MLHAVLQTSTLHGPWLAASGAPVCALHSALQCLMGSQCIERRLPAQPDAG